MASSTRISVIIPTYNRLPFLKEAVASVRFQEYSNFELIVVDDGSTDGTTAWLRDQGIKTKKIFHSGKPGNVRNIGTEMATGSLLAFLDSDDLWKPDKLMHQSEYLATQPDVRLCHTRETWLRGDNEISQSGQKHRRSGWVFADALTKCIIGPSTTLLEKSLFVESGGFDPELEIAEDYDLWLRICSRYPVGYIDQPLVVKRGGHPDQLSEKYGQIEIFRIRSLARNIEQDWFSGTHLIMARRELARKCRIYAAGCEKRGKSAEALRYYRKADTEDPECGT